MQDWAEKRKEGKKTHCCFVVHPGRNRETEQAVVVSLIQPGEEGGRGGGCLILT